MILWAQASLPQGLGASVRVRETALSRLRNNSEASALGLRPCRNAREDGWRLTTWV